MQLVNKINTILYDLKMPNEDIMAVVKDIFGCETSSGLIHSGTPTDYDQQVRVLLEKWNIMSGKHQEFAIYFQENKQEQFKYHLCRYSVKASQVVDCSDFFYNNSCEFINKLLKLWQGKKKVDCLKFAEQIQDLARCQEGDVLRAYMSMPSPFVPRERFTKKKIDFSTNFNTLTADKKKKNQREVVECSYRTK